MGSRGSRRNAVNADAHLFWEMPPSDMSKEKTRARDLKSSSWWRQKLSRGICHYCGKKFKPEELTMDHIIPLSRGGTSEKINITVSCKDCNNKKKYFLPSEWEEYQKTIGEESVSRVKAVSDDGDER